jgi:hypothetical protein
MATTSPVTVLIKYLSQRDNQFIRPASLFELKHSSDRAAFEWTTLHKS